MSKRYEPQNIEKKWQKIWQDEKAFAATDDYTKPKYYALVEFPYPSGQGLHVGHPRPYTALDIVARKRRMQGYNVLYPMGWDAFGLPTENYAIKNHIHPKISFSPLDIPLTGTERSTPPIRSTITGPSGFSSNSSKQVLLTRKKCRSTGVLPVR